MAHSGLWDPSTWRSGDDRPTAAEVIVDQFDLEIDPTDIEQVLESDYQATIWQPGGLDPT